MNNLRSHVAKLQKPPIAVQKQDLKERKRSRVPEWKETSLNENLPSYKVAEDKYSSGYLASLNRQKRLKPYLKMVYKDKDPTANPGHIRPAKGNRTRSNKPMYFSSILNCFIDEARSLTCNIVDSHISHKVYQL